jgi:hypothetical protein
LALVVMVEPTLRHQPQSAQVVLIRFFQQSHPQVVAVAVQEPFLEALMALMVEVAVVEAVEILGQEQVEQGIHRRNPQVREIMVALVLMLIGMPVAVEEAQPE